LPVRRAREERPRKDQFAIKPDRTDGRDPTFMMTVTEGSWVRLSDLTKLPAPECVDLLAQAMEEWALAQALVVIHGPEHGWTKYVERGGHVRQDANGEPVIWRRRCD
jgi:hypothetical protein